MWKNLSIPSVSLSGKVMTCYIEKSFAEFETAFVSASKATRAFLLENGK
jgi:hypothetical protein